MEPNASHTKSNAPITAGELGGAGFWGFILVVMGGGLFLPNHAFFNHAYLSMDVGGGLVFLLGLKSLQFGTQRWHSGFRLLVNFITAFLLILYVGTVPVVLQTAPILGVLIYTIYVLLTKAWEALIEYYAPVHFGG